MPVVKRQSEVNLNKLTPALVGLFRGDRGSDRKEWDSIVEHGAVELITGLKQIRRIEKEYPARIMGSRYVRAWKDAPEPEPALTGKVNGKSRLAAQGHLDPDLEKKIAEGKLSSPTIAHSTLMAGL